MCQICCLQNVSIKFYRVGTPPVLRGTKKPSTNKVKRSIRVFQSQICRQQVVTPIASCIFVHAKKFLFENINPREMR